jgi:Flp pilus assembly protein TadD
VWATEGGKPAPARATLTAGTHVAQARHTAAPTRHTAAHRPAPHRAAKATPTVTGVPAASTTPAPTADTLEARGHSLLTAGSYGQAIPVLRQAVAAASPSSLTYAYALFDLGRALRLSGDPRDAAVVLYRRLQIPNQTDAVRAELALALQALGQAAGSGPAAAGGHDRGRHRGHGPGDHAPPADAAQSE